ncbi:hypothetical protein [Nonomuraea sp. GTA35]|uniref:hypothetical protein n=1 Tax=Nonomuraea sp. GTA35 TaxID=1676746 RepID=UPI0035BF5ACE
MRGRDVRPATARQAATRLEREAVIIRQWARRYSARVLGRAGREVVYDYDDVATIEGCIWRGDPAPRPAKRVTSFARSSALPRDGSLV